MMSEESPPVIRVGCAGWSVPKEQAARFPDAGSHLERYAERLPAVEINSSFYRPHRPSTYARWAESVPSGFRFAVKIPREITHLRRLSDSEGPLDRFLAECGALGNALGPLLVQLPPSLAFEGAVAASFFAALRDRFSGNVVCEPRHPSWFQPEAGQALAGYRVSRVAADPAAVPSAARPGGWEGLAYYRLHGSPRVYYSSYPETYLITLTDGLREAARSAPVWCIFDNTAQGAATANALAVIGRLRSERPDSAEETG